MHNTSGPEFSAENRALSSASSVVGMAGFEPTTSSFGATWTRLLPWAGATPTWADGPQTSAVLRGRCPAVRHSPLGLAWLLQKSSPQSSSPKPYRMFSCLQDGQMM
jgi:hypothetical protein